MSFRSSESDQSDSDRQSSAPWEALHLVARRLDPTSLAVATCVSKTWNLCLSDDELWVPHCTAHFPTLTTTLRVDAESATPPVPLRLLFAVCHAASRRRLRPPPPPRISLAHVVLAIDVRGGDGLSIAAVTRPGDELGVDKSGVFRFRVEVPCRSLPVGDAREGIRVSCHVALKGLGAVFSMMDDEGEGKFMFSATEGWFTKELPAPGCCSVAVASCLVAELRLGLSGGGEGEAGQGKRMVDVSVGVMDVPKWRYVTVEEALRYLQHFLVPCQFCQ